MGRKTTPNGAIAITLIRSPIGTPRSHRIILRGLGLRRLRHTVIRPNTPQVKGLVHKLSYLLEVRDAGKEAAT
jgi:large subunit ribosomal protein L30